MRTLSRSERDNKSISWIFQSVPNPIVVEGHTDSRPIHNEKFPSNWELSSARAANMIHHLIEVYNVDDKRLAAVGYADTKPIVPNDSPQNWEKTVALLFI